MTYKQKCGLLESYKLMDKEIDCLIEEKQKWFDRALKVTSTFGDGAQRSGSFDKVSNTIEKMDSIERKINNRIDELVDLRESIEKAAEKLQDEILRKVIIFRYINGKTVEQTAEIIGYCPRQIQRLHKKAVELLDLHCKIAA